MSCASQRPRSPLISVLFATTVALYACSYSPPVPGCSFPHVIRIIMVRPLPTNQLHHSVHLETQVLRCLRTGDKATRVSRDAQSICRDPCFTHAAVARI